MPGVRGNRQAGTTPTTMDRNTMTTATEPFSYWRLWRGVPRELLYLLISYPLALAAFVATITLVSSGLGTLITFFIGVVLLIAALYIARGFGWLDITLLEWTGREPIERPDFRQVQPGFWGWLKSVFANGHYWLYLLWAMIVNFVVSLITWTLTVVVASVVVNGFSFWIWGNNVEVNSNGGEWTISQWLGLAGADASPVQLHVANSIVYFILGLIFLAMLPFVTRGFTLFHHLVARGLLGASRSDALRQRVGALTAAGAAASSAEGHSLRRLERDIHDGPQQRLVRMQMDLSAADRQIEKDPEKARALIAEAMEQSKEALEELRSLSRGFAPPILLDRGLIAALESAAVRSTVPTRVSDETAGFEIAQELERNAYFVASEALANAAKHSGATSIDVVVRYANGELVVTVTDDGIGGAEIAAGHGLDGLEQRVRGFGGTLELSSPDGGPTVVSARFPASE